MSKYHYNRKKPWLAILIIAAVLGVGYFLVVSAPRANRGSVTVLNDSNNTSELNSLIGKKFPDMQLADINGKSYTATDFKGKYTILFFNEGLICYPACWNQIAAFGSDQRFNSDQIQAFPVVVDPPESWQTAIAKMPKLGQAKTLFDSGAAVSRGLGMLDVRSSMHTGSLPGHTYVLLDKDGVVRFVFDDPNMGIANDALFNKIEELNK